MILVWIKSLDILQTDPYVEGMAFAKNVKLTETGMEEEELDLPKERVKINLKFVVQAENVNYLHVNFLLFNN